ncbi:MAG: DUF1302 family protein [Deltaproteobacteria bacterium]|nr:DUF1302 family protein [Deltaproteobacteria bacterium]
MNKNMFAPVKGIGGHCALFMPCSLSIAVIILGVLFAVIAQAADFKFGETTLKLDGALTLGTAMRTNDRTEKYLNSADAASIGVVGTTNQAHNGDDGRLNYGKGDIVSTVLKGVVSGDLKYQNVGLFARVRG